MEPASKKRKTDAAAGSNDEAKLDMVKDKTVVKKMTNGDAQSGGRHRSNQATLHAKLCQRRLSA